MSLRRFFRRRRTSRAAARMPRPSAPTFRVGRALTRGALLAGVSAVALWTAAPAVYARSPNSGTGAVTSAPTDAMNAAISAAQQASGAATRATQAIQAMQAAQSAARAAALAAQHSATLPQSSVPNGLAPGGLVPDSGLAASGVANSVTTWTGASTPTQSTDASGQTNVAIRQTAAQAILNWNSFNIGARTTLNFDQQGNANWVALNRVNASTAPSQILGNINAAGQVYVINQNGIIFGGASQINVGSLIASSAGITDQQFLNNGIYSAQNGSDLYAELHRSRRQDHRRERRADHDPRAGRGDVGRRLRAADGHGSRQCRLDHYAERARP